jgi:hypothetical protein
VAPATESIMGSLPLAKAGVGSAMNDTTRQVGGALGVAVLGSILASSYAAAIQPALQGAPPQLAQTAGDSIGAAATIAAQLGPQGQGLLQAARSAFIQGMSDAVQVGAGAAALAALLVLLFLPARATARTQEPSVPEVVEAETAEVQDSLTDDFLDGRASPPSPGLGAPARPQASSSPPSRAGCIQK